MSHPADNSALWAGQFGREYTDRNPGTWAGLDALYTKRYGESRSAMNARFLSDVPKSAAILEVGCNKGAQLDCLAEAGYSNLSGIDCNSRAVAMAGERVPKANLRVAKATSIPFTTGKFDLVFTSGVLIHISPLCLGAVIDEMARVSRRWIWGFEYAGNDEGAPVTGKTYRGHRGIMWTGDFAQAIQDRRPEFRIVKREYFRETDGGPLDQMYLLERKGE